MASTIDRNHGWKRSCTIKANIVRTLRHEHRVTLPYLYEKWCKIYFGISHWPCDGYFWIRGHTLVYDTSGLLHWEITSSMEIMTRNFTIAFGHTHKVIKLYCLTVQRKQQTWRESPESLSHRCIKQSPQTSQTDNIKQVPHTAISHIVYYRSSKVPHGKLRGCLKLKHTKPWREGWQWAEGTSSL